jgi:3-deoxy-manno-octulosonate cytidylyltransferase (CMP-KDO synthetase)
MNSGIIFSTAVFSTAVTSLKLEDAFDTNRVKCVVDNLGYVIFFKRADSIQ